ncbi:MAG: RloB family protein [bacterium]
MHGEGDHTLSLVEAAQRRDDLGPFDETWVVLDRDSFPPERFRAALALARSQDIQVAWTNEAFEAWYLLHFHYCDSALSRATYKERLTAALGRPYQKNDPGLYADLLPRQAPSPTPSGCWQGTARTSTRRRTTPRPPCTCSSSASTAQRSVTCRPPRYGNTTLCLPFKPSEGRVQSCPSRS